MLAHLRVQELDKTILKESLGKQNPAWFHSCDICESVEQTHQPLAGEISWQTWSAHWKQGKDPEAQSGSHKEQCSYGGRSLWFTSFPLWHQVWEELSLLSKFPGNYILKEIEHNVQVLKCLTRHFPFCLSRYLLFFWHCSDEHVMPLKYSDEQESWLQNIPGVRVSFLSHWFMHRSIWLVTGVDWRDANDSVMLWPGLASQRRGRQKLIYILITVFALIILITVGKAVYFRGCMH